MYYKEMEDFSSVAYFYNLKDKAYNHVMLRTMKALEKAEEIRNNIKTLQEFKIWQEKIKGIFKASIGEMPYDSTFPLNARITGRIEEADVVIENIIFEAREKVYVTANLYIPKEREGKCPAVLLQCGHSLNGKSADAYQRAARIIANAGIMVLVMDPPGQGERCFYIENGIPYIQGATSEHKQFGDQCFMTGASPVKYFLADAMRAIDYLCSREDVDAKRIGATGNSGGGTMTAALMAIDDRIKAAAPSCWPTSGWEYFLQGCSPDAEQIWPDTTGKYLDHCEIIACMCPKPLLLLSMEEDFVPIEGTEKLYAECRKLWELNDSGDKLSMHTESGKHSFSEGNAREAARFFASYLCDTVWGNVEEMEEKTVRVLPEQKLYCTISGQVRTDYQDSLTVFEENLREFQKHGSSRLSLEERKQNLYEKVYRDRKPVMRFHVRSLNKQCGKGICAERLMWFTQELMPCYGVSFAALESAKDTPSMTVCLWQGGTDQLAVHQEEIRQICKKGRMVLVADLTAMGKCTPNAVLVGRDPCGGSNGGGVTDKLSKALFMLGDSLCAIKAFDLLQTIKMLREKYHTADIEIYAEGKYAVLARIAEMLDEDLHIRTYHEVTVSELIRDKYYDPYDVAQILMPGLGRYLDDQC